MSYEPVYIYNANSEFVGYGIIGENKLQTTNVYGPQEEDALKIRIGELNKASDIRNFWPHPQDPEVIALLDDPSFHPVETELGKTLDKVKSYLVYEQIPVTDENGRQTGVTMEGDLDTNASVLVYKDVPVPVRPSDIKLRLQHALETVARRRADLVQ